MAELDDETIMQITAEYRATMLEPKLGDTGMTEILSDGLEKVLRQVAAAADGHVTWEIYLKSIEGLPLPTDEQADRFVNTVVNIHDWYKKLANQGERFVFGLQEGQFLRRRGRRTPDLLESEGYLDMYWINEQCACPVYTFADIRHDLPPELVELGVEVNGRDYNKPEKTSEMVTNIRKMRELIAEKRQELGYALD